jgi:hypothetical protein
MTPQQEKARELVKKFAKELGTFINPMIWRMAKQCAIICCEEILKSHPTHTNTSLDRQLDEWLDAEIKATDFYKQVIEEINKL